MKDQTNTVELPLTQDKKRTGTIPDVTGVGVSNIQRQVPHHRRVQLEDTSTHDTSISALVSKEKRAILL